MTDPVFDDMIPMMQRQATSLLENIGIRIRMTEIPEYMEYSKLRDRLDAMCRLRRWLSFRLRKRESALYAGAQMALMNAVMEGR